MSVNRNIIYLGITQVSQYLIPLITFPYMTRVLGIESFGILGIATAIIAYVNLITQYGFNLSATAKISQLKNEKEAITKYYYTVLTSKVILLLGSILLLFVCVNLLTVNDELKLVLICLIPGSLGHALFPLWLFQGLEKMKVLTLFIISGRLFTLPIIFIVIKGPEDVWLAAIVQSSSFLITALISIFYIHKSRLVGDFPLGKLELTRVLKEGWHIFITTVSASVYSSSVPIIIGLICGPIHVAYYNVANMVKTIMLNLISAVYQAVFPRINKLVVSDPSQAYIFMRKYFYGTFLIGFLGVSIVYSLSDWIVVLASGEDYLQAGRILKYLSLAILLSIINNFLGVQTLIPFGFKKQFSKIIFICGLSSLFISIPMIYYYQSTGAAISIIISEALVFICLLSFHIRNVNFNPN